MRIYALVSDEEVLYVGKTTRSLNKRAIEHKCDKTNTTGSKFIPKDIVWDIKLLEEVLDKQGTEYERFYVEYLEPKYNKQIPGRTKAESYKAYCAIEKNKAKIITNRLAYRSSEHGKEVEKEYFNSERHRQIRKAKDKRYYDKKNLTQD